MADAASAVAGFAGINPWVGIGMMGAGALASGIQAIKRSSDAKKLEAEYERLDKNLQPVSPEQYAYLNRVRQLERGMRMGTDPTSAMARRGLAQGLGQTQTNIARMGGGASTVSGLLRAQQGYNVGMGNVAAQAGQQADRMLMYQGGLIDNIQSRIYDLQMKRRNYAQLKAVAMREGAQDATSAAIGALAQGATMIPKYNENIDTSKLNQSTKSAVQGASKSAIPSIEQAMAPRIQQSIASDRGPVTGVLGPTGQAIDLVYNTRMAANQPAADYGVLASPAYQYAGGPFATPSDF